MARRGACCSAWIIRVRILLYEPEIPPNTGNIARLCAAYGVPLHLVEPLGFKLENRYLKRAGLDYWPHVSLRVWKSWRDFLANGKDSGRLVMLTTKASRPLQDFPFLETDTLVFGPETRGLPNAVLQDSPCRVRIPMLNMEEGGARSLNLSTAAGIALFTALNRCGALQNFS